MKVRVRRFAGLRERAGWSERELDGVTSVGEVWPVLGLGPEPEGLLYAVNKAYAARERELRDGDEVAVIPPVSGGSFRLSAEPLSLEAVVEEVRDERAGAIATFVGTTRVESRGRTVEHLDYEAFEGMAENGEHHALQAAFWEKHGLQCGFCTPGMIMTAAQILERHPKPTEEQIRHQLEGNLCRCTGYHNIVKAIQWAAENMAGKK